MSGPLATPSWQPSLGAIVRPGVDFRVCREVLTSLPSGVLAPVGLPERAVAG